MHVFGLTGGFATGKSSVVARLKERGVPVVEADVLAREVVRPGTPGLARVVDEFGPGVLDASGGLDRKRLGKLVFADAEARRRLESLVHPLIRQAQRQKLESLAQLAEPLACYEAPLLIEVGLASELRPLVVVAADVETQVARAMRRDGLDEAAVRARIAAQMPVDVKRKLADYVIENRGSLAALHAETDRVLDAICASVGVPAERYPR